MESFWAVLTLLTCVSCSHCPCRPVAQVAAGTSRPAPREEFRCNVPTSAFLPIERISQERSQLCWAASGQMVMSYFNKNISQCDEMRDRRRIEAPNSPVCQCVTCPVSASIPTGDCNNGGWPNFSFYGFEAERLHGALRLDELKAEIGCRHSPVAFSWRTDSNSKSPGGHMMVAYGYDGDMIAIAEPLPVCGPSADDPFENAQEISYDEYLNGDSPISAHWDDFYAISPKRIR